MLKLKVNIRTSCIVNRIGKILWNPVVYTCSMIAIHITLILKSIAPLTLLQYYYGGSGALLCIVIDKLFFQLWLSSSMLPVSMWYIVAQIQLSVVTTVIVDRHEQLYVQVSFPLCVYPSVDNDACM